MEVFKKEVNGQTVNYQEITTETVVANPTAEGTEQLQKLQVGNTVYNMPEGGGGNYVLELTGDSGTLTDVQYQAVVDNFPNVSILYNGSIMDIMKVNVPTEGMFIFANFSLSADIISTTNWVILPDKSWSGTLNQVTIPASSGLQVKQITFTDRPSLWTWLHRNATKILNLTSKMNRNGSELTVQFNGVNFIGTDNTYFKFQKIQSTSTIDNLSIYITNIIVDSTKITIDERRLVKFSNPVEVGDYSATEIADNLWTALQMSVEIYYIE